METKDLYKKMTANCDKCNCSDATYSKLLKKWLCDKHRREELLKWAKKQGLIAIGVIIIFLLTT